METRFILPVTVATALHALVLFGIKPSRVAPPPVEPGPAIPVRPTPFEFDVEPPVADPEEDATPVEQPKGRPEAYRPENEDVPRPEGGIFEQPRLPTAPPRIGPPTLAPGVFGVPDGVEGGWSDRPVLPAKALDAPPRTRAQVTPLYPDEARREGLTGEVWVAFVVDESGHVLHPRVVRSTDRRFEAPTLRAVEHWRFEPGKKNQRAVRFEMVVPVVFNLDNK